MTSGCGPSPKVASQASAQEKKSSTLFTDVTEAAGIRYQWTISGSRPLNILQTIGNGCAFMDYDRDGNLDILLVGSKGALFKGNGKGHFSDVSEETGLSKVTGHLLGCAVGDIEGDGYDDVYITGYRAGVLLRNEAGRSFRDITKEAGLMPQPWSTSAGFFEAVPGSGKLDLFIANYAVFGPNVQPQLCNEQGIMTSCGPRHYKALKGVLYQNDGRGHFTDISAAAGVTKAWGRGLGVAFADYDGAGRPSIVLANDEMPGDLFRSTVNGAVPAYKNVSEIAGTAYDRDGNVHGGMGTDWGDYDNDGKFDLFVATFMNESKSLYHNDGNGLFTDMGIPSGIGSPTAPFVAFGCKFFDYDNDGWLDLVIANGHVQDNIQQIYKTATYRQSAQLFRNNGGSPATFADASSEAGKDFQQPIVGRGLATGDYDNDGRIDLLIVDSEGRPLLLHNEGKGAGHWLGVRLEGTKSNRNGYGGVLTAHVGGQSLMRQCQSAGSYMSASDPRVHFGLGSAAKVDTLTVHWPSGRTDAFNDVPADRYIILREGDPAVK